MSATRFESTAAAMRISAAEVSISIILSHGIHALAEEFPSLPKAACFDTRFHRAMPEVTQISALPLDLPDTDSRRQSYVASPATTTSRQVWKHAPGDRQASRRGRQPMRHVGQKKH